MRLRLPRIGQRALGGLLLCLVPLGAGARPLPASNKLGFPTLPGVLYVPGNLGQITVAVENSSGTVISSGGNSTAPVKLAITGPGGFNQTVTATAVKGIATLDASAWSLTTAGGTYSLSASTTTSGIASASAQVITASTALPPTAVGSTAAAQSFTFGFASATQVSSVAVLFLGAPNLDFTQSGTSNCVGSQSAGTTCTVSVLFSPKAMGLRLGAIELVGSGGVLQRLNISGVGHGAGVSFSARSQATIGTMTGQPDALAFDAQGNLLVADYPTSGTGRIVKIPLVNGVLDTAQQTTFGSGLNYADGLAVDGAGNVFVSDYDENKVLEVPAGAGANITLLSGTAAVYNPAGLAFDGAGDLFICDYSNGRLIEILSQNGQLNPADPIYFTAGFENPSGVKVDANGNVFVADWGNNTIQEIPFQNGALNPAAQTTLITDFAGQPSNIALDAAGDLYVPLETANSIEVVPNQGGTYSQSNAYLLAQNLYAPDAVLVDAAGNVIFCDTYNGLVYEVDNVDPPSLSFPSTGVGQVSATQKVPVLSVGNQPLSISSIVFGGDFPNQGSSCSATLQPGYRCDLIAGFAPTALGTRSQSATISDNAVNQTSSTQSVAMSGVGVPGPQSIAFTAPASVAYGSAALTLTASGGGSGNPVTFSQVSGPATLSGSSLSVTGVGTVVVAANQAGNAQYTAAPSVQQSISVSPAVLTVAAQDATMAYGAAVPGFSFSFAGFVNGDGAATAVTGAPALTTSATSSSPAGSYPIVAAFGSLHAANYNFVFVNGTLTVTATAPATTWSPAGAGLVYGDSIGAGVLDGSSPVPGAWAYSYNGSTVRAGSVLPAGTDTITAVFSPYDRSDYNPVSLSRDIVIAKAVLSVTASNVASTYGSAVPAFTAYGITGFVNGDSSAVVSGAPVLASAASSSSPVGSYPITVATGSLAAANYTFAGVSGKLTINTATAPATWIPTTPATFTYGTSLAGFVHASSPVAGTWSFHLNGALITGAEIVSVGKWEVEAQFAPSDSHDYTPPYLVEEITIQPAPLQVIANNASATPGAPLPLLSYSLSGLVAGDTAGVLRGIPVLSTSATSGSASGTYPITVSLAGVSAGNYTLTAVAGVLTMTRLSSNVSWTPSSGSLVYGASLATVLTATGSTGGALSYTSNGLPVSAATVLGVGSYSLTAALAQDATHTASSASFALTVAPAPLQVTVANASRNYGASNPSFGGTVAGIVNGDAISAVYASSATASSPVGSYSITATLGPAALLANYTITNTPGTLAVTAIPTTVTWTPGAATITYGNNLAGVLTASASTGAALSYTSNLGPASAASVLPAGNYTLTASLAADATHTASSATESLTVAPVPLRVTVANASRVYGAANPTLGGTLSGVVNGDAIVASYATTANGSSPVGTYPITATLAPAALLANYTVTNIPAVLTVTSIPTTVSWTPNTGTITYGTNLAEVLNATSSTGAALAYSVNGSTVNASTVLPAGSYAMTATLAADATHAGASASFALIVAPAPLTVTVASASRIYGAANPPLGGTVAGAVNGEVITATYATTATPSSAVGTYPISAALSPAARLANYAITNTPGVLTVTPIPTSVSWTPATGTLTYGSNLAGLLSATASTGAGISYTANDIAVTAATVLNAGSYTLVATLAADATHAASSASASLSVAPAPLTVTVANASRDYGAANPTLGGTVSGIVNGDGIAATYATSASAASPVGSYPITATLGPAALLANYSVSNTPGVLTVAAAPTTITWTPTSGAITYGTSLAGVLTANASTGGTLGYSIQGNSVASGTVLPVSTYAIVAALPSDANHLASSATFALQVNPAPLRVTVASATRFVGSANPTFSGAVAGAVNGDAITVAYSTTADLSSPAGTYPITAMLGPSATIANYAITVAPGTLTVVEPVQVITFPALGPEVFGGDPIPVSLSAMASSGLPVSYSVTGPASVSGSILTITSAGAITVTASQAGGNGYPAATPVSQSLQVGAGLGFGVYATGTTCGSLGLLGSAVVDSFDSGLGAFPAGQAQSGANIGTNGNLELTGSSAAYGALYDPNGNTQGACSTSLPSLTLGSGNTVLAGGIVGMGQALAYPTPAAPSPAPPTTNQTINYSCNSLAGCSELGGSHHALAPGQYGNLTLGGGAEVDLSAGTYNLNSLNVGGGAFLEVVSGPVVFNLAGSGLTGNVLVVSGSGPVVNPVPANLEFLYAGTASITISGGANVTAVLDAPNAPVTVDGGAVWSGALVGNTLQISGGAQVHYDRALASQSAASGGSAPVAVSPVALDFGSVPVGSTGSPLSLTVTNTTSSALIVSSASASPGFALAGNCTTIAPSASCSFGVSFAPTAPGATTGVVTLYDNAGSGSQSASLTGVGTAAGASLSPTALTFAATSVGGTSFPQLVTLTNSGTLTLDNISIPASAGDFSVANLGAGACGASLTAGSSCSFAVAFTPSSAAAESAALAISDSLGSQVVTLSGTGATPGITLSNSQLGFGSQTVGIASAAQTITITNSSPVAVVIGSATATPMFAENNNCIGTLAAGASCGINISFDPFAAGGVQGSLTLVDNAPSSPQTINLTGTGVEGLQLTPASFDFGSQELGTTSSQQTVHVINTGDATFTLTQVTTSGDFQVSQNGCQAALAPGASCQVFVTYSPSAAGTAQGTLNLADSSGVISGSAVLTGFGTRPGIAAAPSNLAFGSTGVGKTSEAQTVTISNTGNIALTIQALAAQGDFSVVGSNCLTAQGTAQVLAPTATCVVSVDMAPTSYGTRTGSLVINNDVNGQLTVALSGTGQAANVVLTPSQLAFGSQPLPSSGTVTLSGAPQSVTLSNTGNAALSIASITSQGGFTASNNCGTQLAAESSCTISVIFAPTALGQWTGNLTITDDAPSPTQTVAMTGTGSPNGLVLDPSTFSFGGVHRGRKSSSQSSTLTNNTGQKVLNLAISASGEVNETDNCASSLANGASCAITVSVSPTTYGRITGTIAVSGTLGGNNSAAFNATLRRVSAPAATAVAAQGNANLAQIAITAFGNSAALNVAPSRLTFASQGVGATSAPQTVTITNEDSSGAIAGFALASGAEFPLASTTCGSSLAAGASCQAEIAFHPASAGARTASVSITGSDGSEAAVALAGTASGGTLAVNPGSLTFAAIPQGSRSANQNVELQNTGDAALVVQSISVSDPAFSVASSTCGSLPLNLAPNASCSLAVAYQAGRAAHSTGTLTVASTASNGSTTTALSGSVLTPLQIAPATLAFGAQGVGLNSTAQTVTLTNAGDSAVGIQSILAGVGFHATNNCGSALAAGTSCQVQVVMAPAAAKDYSASLAINDAAAAQSVALSGSGTDFRLSAASAPQTINAGGSAAFSVELTPGQFTGTVALACSGAPANATCLATPASVNLVAGGASASAVVTLATRSRSLLPMPPPSRPQPWLLLLAGAWLGGWLLLGAFYRARRLRVGLLGAILTAALAAAACGGVGNYSTAGGGTPPGTYALTITATAGSNVHTSTVTVSIN